MKKLRTILQSKYLFKLIFALVLLIDILYTTNYEHKCKYKEDSDTFIGVVTNYESTDKKLILEISAEEKILVNYKYDKKFLTNLSLGDKLLIKGKIVEINKINILNTFNYEKYLQNKKIYHLIEASSIDKLENNHNYLYTIRNIIYDKIENFKSKDYLNIFILGHNTLSHEVNNSYKILGISHLFSISGMHISVFICILSFYMERVTYNKKIKYIIIDIFLIFYFLLINTSSLLRSTIMYILFSLNYIFKLKIKKLDVIFSTLVVSIIINPFIIFDIGYIYSYLISSFLILFMSKYKLKNKLVKIGMSSFLSFVISFPLNIYVNYEVNILSIFLNIFFVPFVSLIIFPLSMLTLLLPLDNLLFFLTSIMEKTATFLMDINITRFIFPKPSIILIFFYYLFLIFILKYRKYIYLFIVLLLIYYFSPYLNFNFNMTMFDVGQAESIFLKLPNNMGNILIDTGESDYIMINGIIPYLKSMGVRKIDYLIISHGDLDHIGGADALICNFKVEKVIFNRGYNNDLELKLEEILNRKNISYYQNVKKLDIKNNKLYFLNTEIYNNENDNSNIIYFNYDNYKFLFMGDASTKVESELLEKYNLHNIDVLKVGHHGSSSSSSSEFIKAINPKYAIMSVGENNSYGHPNKDVLEILKMSKIYRTDIDGSIMFEIRNSKLKRETYKS